MASWRGTTRAESADATRVRDGNPVEGRDKTQDVSTSTATAAKLKRVAGDRKLRESVAVRVSHQRRYGHRSVASPKFGPSASRKLLPGATER